MFWILSFQMEIQEFCKRKGYLRELNRVFLHPLGLSIQVKIKKPRREDYYFDLNSFSREGIKKFTNFSK